MYTRRKTHIDKYIYDGIHGRGGTYIEKHINRGIHKRGGHK